jgi:hypothetical protein
MLVAVNICRSKITHRSGGLLLFLRRADSSINLKDVCCHDLGASQEAFQVSFSRIIVLLMNQQDRTAVGEAVHTTNYSDRCENWSEFQHSACIKFLSYF